MTAPPANSDEDYYMDESFDEESLSEVDEEPEDQVLEESDSRSDSDVEAEFLRGNPHARRHPMYKKQSGGGSGFAREHIATYPSSSSEDENQVVVTETVAEVNPLTLQAEQTDDETLSVRTLMPMLGRSEDSEKSEVEDDEMEDNEVCFVEMDDNELEEDMEADYDYDSNNLVTKRIIPEKEDDAEIQRMNDEIPNDIIEGNKEEMKLPNDLVDVADASESEYSVLTGESEADNSCGPAHDTDDDFDFIPQPQKLKRLPRSYPNLQRKPILPLNFDKKTTVEVPLLPSLEHCLDAAGDADDGPNCVEIPAPDPVSVKFLEQQMTQMSEMIMKTFRLSGGDANNSALEHLAMATELMKKQGKKLSEMATEEEPESMSTIESAKTPTTVRSEKLPRRKCRCPSNSEMETEQDEFLLDECGQGDGLMRHHHLRQSQSHRINCRVSSVTPSSFNSDNCDYHIDIGRPRSSASSEKVNYKNLGRKSFSFTNPQVREIERQNHILLKKMMNVKPTIKPAANAVKSSSNLHAKKQPAPPAPRLTSAAVNRKKYQRQIDLDNEVLKRKLEAVGTRRPIFK